MRVPFIAGNWKMNTDITGAVNLAREIENGTDAIAGIDIAVCPPFISLGQVKQGLTGSRIKIGAQNMHFEEKGAYTGEISPLMLKNVCDYVILGHSERRQLFGESSDLVNKKTQSALKHGLMPIVCIGENLQEYEAGQTEVVVEQQLKNSLNGLELDERMTIAYEPVWAIGTGRAATGERANYVIGFVRQLLVRLSDQSTAAQIRILYGGSVTPDNIAEIMTQPEIDGGLVGGASLKAGQFIDIVTLTAKISKSR